MTIHDRDDLIRLALTPSADAHAPVDLGDAIYTEILATPQRRGPVRLGRLGWLPAPSPLLVTFGLLALLAIALVIVALARPSNPPILAMYHGGPDRTGVMPGPGPAGVPVLDWEVSRPGPMPFNSMPLPVDGRLFVADGSGALAGLDQATGLPLWEVDVGSPIRATPAFVDGLVVVGNDGGEVVAVQAASGTVTWRTQLGDGPVLASFLVASGVLYAGTEGGTIFAIEPRTGHSLWSLTVGGAVARGAAFADGVLYLGAAGGRFSAIDAETHAVRWAVELGPGQPGTPTVGGGFVYVGRGIEGPGDLHDLVALDIADGSIAWTFAAPGGQQVHMGGLDGRRAYAVSEDGNLSALSPATGELIWAATLGGKLTNPIAIVGDVLYVSAAPRSVWAVDARSGREFWEVPVAGEASSPAVIGGRVFVGTNLGRVVAIGGSAGSSTAP